MASASTGSPAPRARGAARALRWLGRLARAAATGGLLVVLLVLLLAHNLDRPFVKRQIQRLARERAGVEIDYRRARAEPLSGLRIEGLMVSSPPPFRALAPALVTVETIDVGWSLLGERPLRRVAIAGVALTLVVDDDGRSSLDGIGGPPDFAPAPPPPPSRRVAELLAGLPLEGAVTVDGAAMALLLTRDGALRERGDLVGLALSARVGRRGATVDLGSPAASLELALDERRPGEPPRAARARLRAHVDLAPDRAAATLALDVDRQSFSPSLPSRGALLALEASARFAGGRTEVVVERLAGDDGALDSHLALTLDDQPAILHLTDARGSIDLARLARLVPEHLGLRLRSGALRFAVERLELSALPRFEPGGTIALDGELDGVRFAQGDRTLELDGARLSIHGSPGVGGAVALALDLPLQHLRLRDGSGQLAAEGVRASGGAQVGPTGPRAFELRVRFEGARRDGKSAVSATGGDLTLRVDHLTLDRARLLASSGDLSLGGAVASLALQTGAATSRAEQLRPSLRAHLAAGGPARLDLELPIARLALSGPLPMNGRPARIALHGSDLRVDEAAPRRSTGELRLEAELGADTVRATARRRDGDTEWEVAAAGPSLALVAPLAPRSLDAPWPAIGYALRSTGRLDEGAASLRQRSELHLERPAATVGGQRVAARACDLIVESAGGARRQELTVTLRPRALTVDDETLGDGTLVAHAIVDAAVPSLALDLDGAGAALPRGRLHLGATFDRGRRLLTYQADGALHHLAALAPLLPASLTDEHWLDLTDLGVTLSGRGALSHLIDAVDARGLPHLAPKPYATVSGESALDLTLERVRYVDDAGVELQVPSVTVHLGLHAEGERRSAATDVTIARADLVVGGHRLGVVGLRHRIDASVAGDPTTGEVQARQTLSLESLSQDLVPAYPVAHLTVVARARREGDGALRLDELRLDNHAGGTALTASGGLVLARGGARGSKLVGWSSLGLSAQLEQRLDAVDRDRSRFRGGGLVTLRAEVSSGDLRRFHATGALGFRDASLELPARRVTVDHLDGEIPVVEDLRLGGGGNIAIVASRESNAYPALRFSDHQPFLSGRGALRAGPIVVGDLRIDALAGNLRVARRSFSIDQLDAALRGGRLTGQLLVEDGEGGPTARARARASGIEAVAGDGRERFDGNAALVLSLANRSVDGRAEIIHIGRRHLLALLDELDPHHADVAMNRLRTALRLGYPDRVRLSFDRGFASLAVSFGGLARLVRLDEVKGIPMGPLVERYLGPLLQKEKP